MTSGALDWSRLSSLLDEALLLPEGDRPAWLERQQDLPAALRAKLENLLGSGPAYSLPPLPKYPEEAGGEAVLIRRTLRSGRSVHHPGHVVVVGFVNSATITW